MRNRTQTNSTDNLKSAHRADSSYNGEVATTQTGSKNQESSSADRAVEQLHKVDGTINQARRRLINDPDTLGDKAIKAVVPALTGLASGKVFQWIWNSTIGKNEAEIRGRKHEDTQSQGTLMSLVFAALSAVFGAIIGELSMRGTQSFVTRRQHRRK